MLRNVGIAGVVVGALATTSFILLLEILVLPPINLYLYDLFAVERAGGAVSFTGRAWTVYMILSTSLMLGALPLSFLVGGLAAGVVSPSRAGACGLVSALIVVAIGFVWLLATALPRVMDPISNPGEVYTRSDNLQMLFLWGTAFCATSPFALLAGYLGGRIGGRRSESRS